MILSLSREQQPSSFSLIPLRLSSAVVFSLTARVSLSEEERHLVEKYNLSRALLVGGDARAAAMSALRWTIGLMLPVFGGLYVLVGLATAAPIALILSMMCGFGLYDRFREHIFVHDLIKGRTFDCLSIIELTQKEAYLEHILSLFRQVVESSKNWGDAEQIEIMPFDREDARLTLLQA